MTCTLTFCMSTFWLNSGGNLVLLSNFASTPVAMAAVFSWSLFSFFFSLVDFLLRWLVTGRYVLQLLQTHQTGVGNVPFARWLCFGRAG